MKIGTQPVSRLRLLLSIFQSVFALASLVCLGSLSSTEYWSPEPSERVYLWWAFEAFGANCLWTTVVDAVATVLWIGGIGTAAKLRTTTTDSYGYGGDDIPGPYPETGALIAFAVFETILCAIGADRGWAGLKSKDPASNCEDGLASHSSTGAAATTSHLQAGDFSEDITVNVGDGEKKRSFQVPKALFCRRSGYIRSATSHPWTVKLGVPSKAKEVDLSDDNPDVFDRYRQTVLQNTVAVKGLDDQYPKREQSDEVFLELFVLYVLADKLGDPESMNLVIDAIARYCLAVRRVPDRDGVTYAYENSVKTSPLRKLIADVYHLSLDEEGTKDDRLEGMPNEFLVQCTKAKPDVQTVVPGSARYHQHRPIDKQQVYRGLLQGQASS